MADHSKAIVQGELSAFMQEHDIHYNIEALDDIVLDYVISFLADLGKEKSSMEDFDVDYFVEMMDAYFPGFNNIDSVTVVEWMFSLVNKLHGNNNELKTEGMKATAESQGAVGPPSVDDQNGNIVSEASEDSENCPKDNVFEYEEEMQNLSEMFPSSCCLEIQHCLSIACGNVEEAVQLILDRQDSGKSIQAPKEQVKTKISSLKWLDDKGTIKDKVIAKYSLVDTDEHKKTYTPVMPKQAPKKMVRYLDGRIVSTKGERFTEIKKEEDEEMKKTYVSLKPARKYRFH